MEELTTKFQGLNMKTNFTQISDFPFKPTPPRPRPIAILNHQKTVLVALAKNLFPDEIKQILYERKRSDVLSEESVLADFMQGDINYHHVNKDYNYVRAVNYIERKFRPSTKVRPAHIFDVKYHYPHKNSSNAEAPFSTEPFFLSKLRDPEYTSSHNLNADPKPTMGNMKDIIFEWTRLIHHRIKDGTDSFDKHLYYILLHNKSALIDKDDPNKVRSISGFPRPQNIGYIMFFWQLFAYYKRNIGSTPLLWGYETILGGWFKLNNELFRSYMTTSIITLDKSRFDKYFLFQVKDDIDDMYWSWIDFDNGYIPTRGYPDTQTDWTPHKADRLRRLFSWLLYSHRKTPTVIYDGRTFIRNFAGEPSGIYTTQVDDTLYFGITNATCLFNLGFHENDILLYKGEGDDILMQLALFIPPNEHQSFLEEYARIDNQLFGSITKPESCFITHQPNGTTVLGYTNIHGLPHRDTIDLLAQFYHTKAVNPTPSKTMAMAVGFAYASMGLDKRVWRVCKDVFEYYNRQGYTPDERTFSLTFYTDILTTPFIDFTTFPTISEIQKNLLNFDYSAPLTMQRFYNRDWFLADF